MTCIKDISYEILLSSVTPAQSEKYVRDNSDEVFYVPGGYKVRGVPLVGGDSIPVGIKGDDLIFQFVKPCSGLFVLMIKDAQDEIERLRSDKSVVQK